MLHHGVSGCLKLSIAEEVQTFSLMALRESDGSDWMDEAEVIPVPERTSAGGSASSHGQPVRPLAEYHYVGDPDTDTPGPIDRKMAYGEHKGKMFTDIMVWLVPVKEPGQGSEPATVLSSAYVTCI